MEWVPRVFQALYPSPKYSSLQRLPQHPKRCPRVHFGTWKMQEVLGCFSQSLLQSSTQIHLQGSISLAQGWCISQQSFLSLFHKLLPVNILSAFPFGTGIVGAPDLTCPCPQSHLCLSAGFKEQEDHVCCCKIGFFFSPPWQRDPEAPVTQRSSQSSALLLGTSLGYTKAQLPQGNTQQFPPNFLSPHIYKDSFAIIPRQFLLDCAHPLAFHQGQSLLATEESKKRGKLREFSLSFLCCSHQGTEYQFYLWLCFNLNIFLVLLPVAMSFPA